MRSIDLPSVNPTDLRAARCERDQCDGVLLLDPNTVVIGSGPADDGNGGTDSLLPTVSYYTGGGTPYGGAVHITASSVVSALQSSDVSITAATTIQAT